jgi:hypothetical protein
MRVRIDHLIFATPNLDYGVEEIEQLIGIRPTIGGQHPGRWAAKGNRLDDLQRHASENGIALGEVQSGERRRPNGVRLSWSVTDPSRVIAGGVIPSSSIGDNPNIRRSRLLKAPCWWTCASSIPMLLACSECSVCSESM